MSSLENALSILRCFAADTPELTVSQVSVRLGMPKSTVSRLMKTMNESGVLEQNRSTRRYTPGFLAFQLGSLYRHHLKTSELADLAVTELVQRFGLTGYLCVLDGADVVVLKVKQGRYPVRFVVPEGRRLPACTTAVGMTLLARLKDEELRSIHPPVVHYPPTGMHMPIEEVLAELQRVREQKWAEVDERTFAGFGAIAVAVGDAAGSQALAFSLSYPMNVLTSELHDAMVSHLVAAARRIGRKSGDAFWSDEPGEPEPGEPFLTARVEQALKVLNGP